MNKRPILLVDDDENDLLLMQTAFEEIQFDYPIKTVADGQEAIDYLERATLAKQAESPLPVAVLLDLNMPRKTGFEVLIWARNQPHLKGISFIVLTASPRNQDIHRAYELGAGAFLIKPASLEELTRMLKALREWLQTNHFPPGNPWLKRPGRGARAS